MNFYFISLRKYLVLIVLNLAWIIVHSQDVQTTANDSTGYRGIPINIGPGIGMGNAIDGHASLLFGVHFEAVVNPWPIAIVVESSAPQVDNLVFVTTGLRYSFEQWGNKLGNPTLNLSGKMMMDFGSLDSRNTTYGGINIGAGWQYNMSGNWKAVFEVNVG